MTINTSEILDILNTHNIFPEDHEGSVDSPTVTGKEFPDIGEIEEGESVYTTTIEDVFRENEIGNDGILERDDRRIQDWWEEIGSIINEGTTRQPTKSIKAGSIAPPESHCAWYCPIHFFGHSWGIYIREDCILSHSKDIATFIDWRGVHASPSSIARQLLRSAFYAFFLHEQFHHKVESLGLRLLITTGTDRYRPYKSNVYRSTYLTSACLEESLANADSFRRLNEHRYLRRVDKPIRDGLRNYLRTTIPLQPPGYAEGINYFSETNYRTGLYKLQSQALEGLLNPTKPMNNWVVAPNMITALADITENIYVILPKGARPIFSSASIDPRITVSTTALASALAKHHGYQHVAGGKGSHIKLKKPGAQTIILPGNRSVLSPGVVKHALDAIGGYPISRLPDLLEGKLKIHH